jgi:hypothetical protein
VGCDGVPAEGATEADAPAVDDGGASGEDVAVAEGSLVVEGAAASSDAAADGAAAGGVAVGDTVGSAEGAAAGLALDGNADALARAAAVVGSVGGEADWLGGTTVTAREGLHRRPGPSVARATPPSTTTTTSVKSGFRIADGSLMTGARQTESGMCGGASDRSPTFPESADGWLADPERDSIVCLRLRVVVAFRGPNFHA